ncbi:MAG TPA: hypothetical protein VFX59_05400 [Polyangiales bacterium]|nr:hypothetical protein [Polyangiales bacterium]
MHWFEQRAADGYNLSFRTLEDIDAFSATVLPILCKRGLFRSEYEADTLRGNLGLPFAENRHTCARRQAAE